MVEVMEYAYCVGCACLSTYPQKEIICLFNNMKKKIELVKNEECYWEILKKKHPESLSK